MPPTVIAAEARASAASQQTSDGDWVADLDRYRHTAAQILHDHGRVGPRCGACAQPWPCKAACAAAFALEL